MVEQVEPTAPESVDMDEINRYGNAPPIPRAEVIDILNQVQGIMTRLIIILNHYEPDHHAGTESRKNSIVPNETRTSHSGGSAESPVVYTLT